MLRRCRFSDLASTHAALSSSYAAGLTRCPHRVVSLSCPLFAAALAKQVECTRLFSVTCQNPRTSVVQARKDPRPTRGRIAVPSNGPASTNPLQVLTLAQLQRRTSMKWRTHPADVLPLWVAEMDVLLAEPIHRALSDALASGDTGYPAGTQFAEALSEFAIDRWGWSGLAVDRTAIVPDVMMGIVEMLRLVSADGDAVVVNSPVYPPFYSFVEHMNRKIVESPLGPDGRIDLNILEQTFQKVTAE